MIVKIKHEFTDTKCEGNAELQEYISLEDDATIIQLKRKIASCVRIPAERQEIKNFTREFQNDEKITDFWDRNNLLEGSSFMLYERCDGFEVPRDENQDRQKEEEEALFCCFLLILNDAEAMNQKEREQNFIKCRLPPSSSSQSSITLVPDSDDDDDGKDSSSDSRDSSSSESSATTSSSKSSSEVSLDMSRKRSKKTNIKSEIPEKRHVGSGSTIPNRLLAFLVSTPVATCESNNAATPPFDENVQQLTNGSAASETLSATATSESSSDTIHITAVKSSGPKTASESDVNEAVTTSSSENRPPYALISPEKREYISVISSEEKNSKNISISADCAELMSLYFVQFRQSPYSSCLRFDDNFAVITFRNKFWVACDDKNTFDWIIDNTKQLAKPFKAERFRDYMKLHGCTVVLPSVCKSKDLKEVFDLLHKQNAINTDQWVVQKRRSIADDDERDEYAVRRVSKLCSNELLYLFIDKDSKERLEKTYFKLKYCFWKITFEMQ